MIKKYQDVISGVAMFLLAAAYLAGSFQIRSYGDAAVDSRFFPQLLSGMLLMLSIVQIIGAIRSIDAKSHEKNNSSEKTQPQFNLKVILTLATIAVYISLINLAGFIVSSTLFLIAQTMIMAPKKEWRPFLTIAVSAAFSCAVYFIFVYGFQLVLPEGAIFG